MSKSDINRILLLCGAYLIGQYFGNHWWSVLFFAAGCVTGNILWDHQHKEKGDE